MLPPHISEALPQGQGFLRSYVEYAAQCGDAPEIYHVGVALTVLAGAIGKKLQCPYTSGSMLVPNLYTLLIGGSRVGRKTSSMDTGVKLLGQANPESVMPIPGSYEELISQIRATPAGLLTYREFGHFLKTTQRGYGEPIRTVLMDLFDWPTDRAYVRNLKKGKTVVEPPICLSMISTCSTDLLYSYSDTEEWTGGFFGRMLLLYGDRDMFRMPQVWTSARDYLVQQLHQFVHAMIPDCAGFHPYAWQEFERWSRWRDSTARDFPDRVQSHVGGAPTLAAKIALLYAADAGEPTGHGWAISLESIRRAILFVENLYLPSVKHLGEKLALGFWEKDRAKVLNVIESRPAGVYQQEVLKRAKVSLELCEQVTTTLKAEGTIVQIQGAKGIMYRKRPDGEQPQLRLVPPSTGTPPDQQGTP